MSGPDLSSQDIISSDQSSHGISNSSRNVCFLQSPSDHRRSVLLPSSPSPSSASAAASSCSSLCRTRSDGASLPFSYALLTINADHRKQELASSSSYGTKLGNGRERRGGRQKRSSSDAVQKRSVCESAKNMSFVSKQTISEGLEKDDDDGILTYVLLKFSYKKNETFLHMFEYCIMKFLATMGLHST